MRDYILPAAFPTRRSVLAATIATASLGIASGMRGTAWSAEAIRPFKVNIPQVAIDDLRARLAMTRWPERETVEDQSQGIQLAKLRPIIEYWGGGYDWRKAVAQGGDWGSPVTQAMARQAPAALVGIHVNLPATVPADIAALLAKGGPAPAGLTAEEQAAFDKLTAGALMGSRSYATMMGTKPQTIGYAVSDSPVGLAAWMLGHPGFTHWTYDSTDPEKSPDEVLDEISLYWLTNTAASAGRIYWEYGGGKSVILSEVEKTQEIAIPVAITVFPQETYQAPETWARRAYRNLSYFNVAEKGGHFAAWEQPQIFARELRVAFRPLRQTG